MNNENNSTNNLEEPLKNYLTGYGINNPIALKNLLHIDNWKEIAQKERQRRAHRLIENFDIETLNALADGEIEFNHIASGVHQEISKNK